MPRTAKELAEELMSWPECGGFQYERLYELLAEYEQRIEALELRGATGVRCRSCGWEGAERLLDTDAHCPSCGGPRDFMGPAGGRR